MKTAIGLLLTLVGIGILLFGIGSALLQVVGMYEGALNDPLTPNDAAEAAVPATMVRYVLIGCIGIPFLVVGKVMMIVAWRSRVRARRAAVTGRSV